MEYKSRELERKFLKMNRNFKAILVTGARQVGKTTMLKHLAEGTDRTYVTMDNMMARELAKSDPVLFFQTYKPPILIDEIQKAPELFEQIKIMCDESEEKSRFWITGSQQYKMMSQVRETMAGRIGILSLYSLSQREKAGILLEDEPDFSLQALLERQKLFKRNNIIDVYKHIWTGGMPEIQEADSEIREEYYNSYIETYLMRDATEVGGISDTVKFNKFLTACAALLLPPFENNELKRLVKMPKLYFCDTALCAYLSKWLSVETLMKGAASGHYYENYVVMEFVKTYAYSKAKANLSYYRDSNAKEIDIFIEENDMIHPIEIKKSANPDRREVKKYSVIDKTSLKRGEGGIVCMCEEVIPIDEDNCFIPSNII